MTEAQALLLVVSAEIRRRWRNRDWYRRQRDLAAGRARTFEAATVHAQGWSDDLADNDRRLLALVDLLRAARALADAAPDPMDAAKARIVYGEVRGDTELERMADWAR